MVQHDKAIYTVPMIQDELKADNSGVSRTIIRLATHKTKKMIRLNWFEKE
jgi:hypothetical protein